MSVIEYEQYFFVANEQGYSIVFFGMAAMPLPLLFGGSILSYGLQQYRR